MRSHIITLDRTKKRKKGSQPPTLAPVCRPIRSRTHPSFVRSVRGSTLVPSFFGSCHPNRFHLFAPVRVEPGSSRELGCTRDLPGAACFARRYEQGILVQLICHAIKSVPDERGTPAQKPSFRLPRTLPRITPTTTPLLSNAHRLDITARVLRKLVQRT